MAPCSTDAGKKERERERRREKDPVSLMRTNRRKKILTIVQQNNQRSVRDTSAN